MSSDRVLLTLQTSLRPVSAIRLHWQPDKCVTSLMPGWIRLWTMSKLLYKTAGWSKIKSGSGSITVWIDVLEKYLNSLKILCARNIVTLCLFLRLCLIIKSREWIDPRECTSNYVYWVRNVMYVNGKLADEIQGAIGTTVESTCSDVVGNRKWEVYDMCSSQSVYIRPCGGNT